MTLRQIIEEERTGSKKLEERTGIKAERIDQICDGSEATASEIDKISRALLLSFQEQETVFSLA